MISLIVPICNEKGAAEATLRRAHEALGRAGEDWEIVAVDDGSTDGTPAILRQIRLPRLRVVTHPGNLGNGAAIKTGIREAKGDLLLTIDADGTYPVEDLPRLAAEHRQSGADMTVGARSMTSGLFSRPHRFAKKVLTSLAQAVTGQRIGDLNSGMRCMNRALAERWMDLSPRRFSFHITLTVASLAHGADVRFVPIAYGERIGRSKLSSGLGGVGHFLKFCVLIPVVRLRSARVPHALPAELLVRSAP